MAQVRVKGIETRDSDNAHAWGDEGTSVWLGVKKAGESLTLPKNMQQAEAFLEKYPSLGWLSEDGIDINTSVDSQKFKALQASTVIKSKITGVERDFSVNALEENLQVSTLYWDHEKPKAVAAGESLVKIKNGMRTLKCWAVLYFEDGDYWKMYVFPTVDVTDRGTLAHKNTDLSTYQLTCNITDEGWMITNNPAYQEGMSEEEKKDFSAASE